MIENSRFQSILGIATSTEANLMVAAARVGVNAAQLRVGERGRG